MGILLVYDVSDEKSFRNVSNWMRQIELNASPGVNTTLIGNKCDVEEDERVSERTRSGYTLLWWWDLYYYIMHSFNYHIITYDIS